MAAAEAAADYTPNTSHMGLLVRRGPRSEAIAEKLCLGLRGGGHGVLCAWESVA